MRIIKAKDYQDMSRKAANIISAQVILKPDCVLGLATGSTPIGTYKQLVEWYEKGDLDFGDVTTVNLDEYKGLPKTHEQSYAYFMRKNLFDGLDIDSENTDIENGMAADEAKECAATMSFLDKENPQIVWGFRNRLVPMSKIQASPWGVSGA